MSSGSNVIPRRARPGLRPHTQHTPINHETALRPIFALSADAAQHTPPNKENLRILAFLVIHDTGSVPDKTLFSPRETSPESIKRQKLTALVLQGYLAHKKLPPPQDHRRALGMILL